MKGIKVGYKNMKTIGVKTCAYANHIVIFEENEKNINDNQKVVYIMLFFTFHPTP